MKAKEINIRLLYKVTQRVFNVGEAGNVKTHTDPSTGIVYAYGSANNVKHIIKERFIQLAECKRQPRLYEQTNGNNNSGKQGAMWTPFDFSDCLVPIFGAWNSFAIKENAKSQNTPYRRMAVKSCLRFSPFIPLHPLLSSLNGSCGVNRGITGFDKVIKKIKLVQDAGKKAKSSKDENNEAENSVDIIDDNNYIFEEIMDGYAPYNFFRGKKTANGIYALDITVDLTQFGKVKAVELSDGTKKGLEHVIEEANNIEGWEYDGEEFICPSDALRKKSFDAFIDAIFNWDFTTNNSVDGKPIELLRVSFAVNNTSNWDRSTYAKMVAENKAEMVIVDDAPNVHNFNTPLLESCCVIKDAKIDANAPQNAATALKKIGHDAFDEEKKHPMKEIVVEETKI